MLSLRGAGLAVEASCRQQDDLYCPDVSLRNFGEGGQKRSLSGQESGGIEESLPWQLGAAPPVKNALGGRKAYTERTVVGQRGPVGEATRQQVEVPCPGAVPGEERSVRLPDGRECLVRVPSDVRGDRFFVQWVPILPAARKRRRTGEATVVAKDTKKTWKHADALIAARASSTLATSELLRLRAPPPPRTRIFAPPVDQLPAHDASDTIYSEWTPVNSNDVGEMKLDAYAYDDALGCPATSSTLFSVTSSNDLFGISDFLL